MAISLVVQVPFWNYERGSTISDPAEIEKALEHHAHFVTQVDVKTMEFQHGPAMEDLHTRLGPEK